MCNVEYLGIWVQCRVPRETDTQELMLAAISWKPIQEQRCSYSVGRSELSKRITRRIGEVSWSDLVRPFLQETMIVSEQLMQNPSTVTRPGKRLVRSG